MCETITVNYTGSKYGLMYKNMTYLPRCVPLCFLIPTFG